MLHFALNATLRGDWGQSALDQTSVQSSILKKRHKKPHNPNFPSDKGTYNPAMFNNFHFTDIDLMESFLRLDIKCNNGGL